MWTAVKPVAHPATSAHAPTGIRIAPLIRRYFRQTPIFPLEPL
jgi:hypothetical protein